MSGVCILTPAESDYNGHISIRTVPLGQWKKVCWPLWVTFSFTSYGRLVVFVAYLRKRWYLDALLEEGKPAETVWWRFVAILCWKTMGPAIHVDDRYHLLKYCCRPETSLQTGMAWGAQQWVEGVTWPPNSPDHSLIKHLWDVCLPPNYLVADTMALRQRSCGVNSMTGQSCIARCGTGGYNVMANACLSTF